MNYQSYDINEISLQMRKLRKEFQYIYKKYKKCQNTLNKQYDIIEKDVVRIDPHLFKNCQFNNTYPQFTPDTYRKAIKLILILLIQFYFSQIQTLQDEIQLVYLQGMHEIVAFVLFMTINQLSSFNNQQLNQLNFVISAAFQDVIADAYSVSKEIIRLLLPLYNQQKTLEDMSQQCQKYVEQSEDKEFQKQLQKSIRQVPDFVTFCQKSFKLFFLRDFNQQTTLKVWDIVLSVDRIIQNSFHSFLSYLLSQIFVFRIKNRGVLNLHTPFDIFVPNSLNFPEGYNIDDFLIKVVKNFIVLQQMDYQFVVVDKIQKIQNYEQQQIQQKINKNEEVEEFINYQIICQKIEEQLNEVINQLINYQQTKQTDSLIKSKAYCQTCQLLLDGNLRADEIETPVDETKYINIQTPEQLLDESYIVDKLYRLIQ